MKNMNNESSKKRKTQKESHLSQAFAIVDDLVGDLNRAHNIVCYNEHFACEVLSNIATKETNNIPLNIKEEVYLLLINNEHDFTLAIKQRKTNFNTETEFFQLIFSRIKPHFLRDSIRAKVVLELLERRYPKNSIPPGYINRLGFLIKKLNDEEHGFSKRSFEKTQIQDLDIDDLRLTLCGYDIPSELVRVIFIYIPKNLESLNSIGVLSEKLYLIMLTSFRHITISKKCSMYDIPVLVLQSCRKITYTGKAVRAEYVHFHDNTKYLEKLKLLSSKEGSVISCITSSTEKTKPSCIKLTMYRMLGVHALASRLPNLQRLVIGRYCGNGNCLCKLKSLRKLSYDGTIYNAAFILDLRKMVWLEELSFSYISVHMDELANLIRLKQLKYVKLIVRSKLYKPKHKKMDWITDYHLVFFGMLHNFKSLETIGLKFKANYWDCFEKSSASINWETVGHSYYTSPYDDRLATYVYNSFLFWIPHMESLRSVNTIKFEYGKFEYAHRITAFANDLKDEWVKQIETIVGLIRLKELQLGVIVGKYDTKKEKYVLTLEKKNVK